MPARCPPGRVLFFKFPILFACLLAHVISWIGIVSLFVPFGGYLRPLSLPPTPLNIFFVVLQLIFSFLIIQEEFRGIFSCELFKDTSDCKKAVLYIFMGALPIYFCQRTNIIIHGSAWIIVCGVWNAVTTCIRLGGDLQEEERQAETGRPLLPLSVRNANRTILPSAGLMVVPQRPISPPPAYSDVFGSHDHINT